MRTFSALGLFGILLLAGCSSSKSGGGSSAAIDCAAFASHMVELTKAAMGTMPPDESGELAKASEHQREMATKSCERQKSNPAWAAIYDCVMKADTLDKASGCMVKH